MAGAITAETFGGRVRIARLEARRTGDSLARELGFTRPWVYAVESGRSTPDPDTVARLARVLSVSPGWLVSGEESGDSEFIARLRGAEAALSDGQKREVLALVGAMAAENTATAELEARRAAFLADPLIVARLAELAREADRIVPGRAARKRAAGQSAQGRGRARAG